MRDNNTYNADNMIANNVKSNKPKPKVYLNQGYTDHPEIRAHLDAIAKIIEANPEILDSMTTLPLGSGLDTMERAEIKGTAEFQKLLQKKNRLLDATNKWADNEVKSGKIKFAPLLTLVRRVNDIVAEVPEQGKEEFVF